jgi:hypothetical protein
MAGGEQDRVIGEIRAYLETRSELAVLLTDYGDQQPR